MVSTPIAASFVLVTGPTPHSFPTGMGWRISNCFSAGITNVPSGLASPEPILANCLPEPAPIELGRPVSARISSRRLSAHSFTSSGLAPIKASGSIKASSTESCSITPTCSARILNTLFDAAEYTTCRGCTTTPRRPTSCWARKVGMAEWAPNARAS